MLSENNIDMGAASAVDTCPVHTATVQPTGLRRDEALVLAQHKRMVVHRIAPLAITQMFEFLIHPGVYETVGLPGMTTWKAVNRLPERVALRHAGTRPVLDALIDAGMVARGRVPSGWQTLCGVDRAGHPAA